MVDTAAQSTDKYNQIGARLKAIDKGAYTAKLMNVRIQFVGNSEGNSGSTSFVIAVDREGDLTGSSSVNWAITGTGTYPAAASDFGGTLPSGSLSWSSGETTKTATFNVSGDTTVERSETFLFTASSPSGADLGYETTIGTILNDENSWPNDEFDAEFAGNTLINNSTVGALGGVYNNTSLDHLTISGYNANGNPPAVGYGGWNAFAIALVDVGEGWRCSDDNSIMDYCYTRITNFQPGDHGDGWQSGNYTLAALGGPAGNIKNAQILRSKFVMTIGGSNSCAVFLASYGGVDLKMDSVWLEGEVPNALLGLFNSPNPPYYEDIGVRSVDLNNVVLKLTGSATGVPLGTNSTAKFRPKKIRWNNVRDHLGNQITFEAAFPPPT